MKWGITASPFNKFAEWGQGRNESGGVLPHHRTVVGQFFAGQRPFDLVSDGAKIWLTNDLLFSPGTVTVLRASDGRHKGAVPVGGRPGNITFDGSQIWLTQPDGGTVIRLRAKDGRENGVIQVDAGPTGILFDGTSIWVACNDTDTVNKITLGAQ